jgi:hypothetical protein
MNSVLETKIQFRPAQQSDCRAIASLYSISSDGAEGQNFGTLRQNFGTLQKTTASRGENRQVIRVKNGLSRMN